MMQGGTKYIAVAGVAGAALVLLRRAMRSSLVTGRNRLKLLTPVPEDIEISQAVKLTPVRELFYNAFGLTDEHLFWLAEEALTASLPVGWKPKLSEGAPPVFVETRSGLESSEHPMDPCFRNIFFREKEAERLLVPAELLGADANGTSATAGGGIASSIDAAGEAVRASVLRGVLGAHEFRHGPEAVVAAELAEELQQAYRLFADRVTVVAGAVAPSTDCAANLARYCGRLRSSSSHCPTSCAVQRA